MLKEHPSYELVTVKHHHYARHKTAPVFIIFYAETYARGAHFQAYRAAEPVPRGRDPWTVDNRRIGPDFGFKTFEDAAQAGETACN